MPKISKHLRLVITNELQRGTKFMYEHDMSRPERMDMLYTMNKLCDILRGESSVNDFHDVISGAPEDTRKYYYELLFEEK